MSDANTSEARSPVRRITEQSSLASSASRCRIDGQTLDVVEFRPLSIALPALEGRIVRQPSQIFESGHDAVLAEGRLVSLMPGYKPVESELSVICPPGKNLSAKVRSLIDFLAARFGPEPPRDEWDTTERTKKSRARRR